MKGYYLVNQLVPTSLGQCLSLKFACNKSVYCFSFSPHGFAQKLFLRAFSSMGAAFLFLSAQYPSCLFCWTHHGAHCFVRCGQWWSTWARCSSHPVTTGWQQAKPLYRWEAPSRSAALWPLWNCVTSDYFIPRIRTLIFQPLRYRKSTAHKWLEHCRWQNIIQHTEVSCPHMGRPAVVLPSERSRSERLCALRFQLQDSLEKAQVRHSNRPLLARATGETEMSRRTLTWG